MQTFLPYPSYAQSAACLDRQRLGKQRLECQSILNALTIPGAGWRNHPATLMWQGHRAHLCMYMSAIIAEWTRRGYKNNLVVPWMLANDDTEPPAWLGDEKFHASHRSNLLRKMPAHYGQFGWTEPNDLPYVWPSPQESTMTKREIKPLPENLLDVDIGGLQNLHSEMLATAHDVKYDPPDSVLVEIETAEQAKPILEEFHQGLQKHLAEMAEAEVKEPPKKKAAAKSPEKAAKPETPQAAMARQKKARLERDAAQPKEPAKPGKKESKKVAKKSVAKKAPAKKAAKKAAPKAAKAPAKSDDRKITWIFKEDGVGAREGSERFERRKKLKASNGKTVEAYVKSGGSIATLNRAVADKLVKVA